MPSFAPCYNFVPFHRVGNLIFNMEMAMILHHALMRSGNNHPAIKALCLDLVGDEGDELPESWDEPFYTYAEGLSKVCLMLNQPMAYIIADAIFRMSENGQKEIPAALWTMRGDLRRFGMGPTQEYYSPRDNYHEEEAA